MLCQWQWLTGFSFWTCLLSLLTRDYVGGFDYTHNWWLLLIMVFIVSVFVPFVYYTWLMDRCKSAPANSDSEVEDPAAQLWAQAVDKSISQIYRSTRWLFWIGVYLTSRQSFNTFDKALSQEEGNDVNPYVFSVTIIALTLGFMLELAKTRIDAYITRQEDDMDAATKEPTIESKAGKTLALIKMKFSHSEFKTFNDFLKLGVSYEVGKAFQAFVFGNTAHSSVACGATVTDCWDYWIPVIIFTTFMSALFGYVMLQWENNPVANPDIKPEWACNGLPQHLHGNLCVCVSCVPSAYPIEEYPGHDFANKPERRTKPSYLLLGGGCEDSSGRNVQASVKDKKNAYVRRTQTQHIVLDDRGVTAEKLDHRKMTI